MKRNWDVVREVLLEVEALDNSKAEDRTYDLETDSDRPEHALHAILLFQAGFIKGADTSTMDGDGIIAQGLTWSGYDLLETIRSKPVWEKIQSLAKEKGLELTFDTIKSLAKVALTAVIG